MAARKTPPKMDIVSTFNCNGMVNRHDWELCKDSLFRSGEVDNVLYPQDEYPLANMEVRLFDCTMPASIAILNFKHFVNCIDMQLKILGTHDKYSQFLSCAAEESDTKNNDFYYIRSIISEFIVYIRIYLISIKSNLECLQVVSPDIEEDFDVLFSSIKQYLDRLRDIPDYTFCYVPSNLGNQCKQPEFHMYHMHLELRWLFVTLAYTRNIHCQHSLQSSIEGFEKILGTIISDLMYISLKVFERTPLTELRQKTPYNCTCVRELWLMLQIFIDSLSERIKSKTFWEHVNSCINELLKNNNSVSNEVPSCYSLPDCKNSELFCLWVVCHLTLLYGYSTDGYYLNSNSPRIRCNYEQVEKILKTYVSKGGKEGKRDQIDVELSIVIPLLSVLITNWWKPQVSIISLLWECFHKRLNQPFLLQTSGPWIVTVEKKSAMDILKQVKERIHNLEYSSESSYGMFLCLLGSFLKKNYSTSDPKIGNQIKGRIFSKFSKGKVAEFSATGLFNFLSLFLTLALTTDTVHVCSVMLDLLPSTKEFNDETSQKCVLVWKGKLTILLIYNEQNLGFSNIANSTIDTVNTISCGKDDTSRTMMSDFVDVFSIILLSSEKMEFGEYLFIGGWIDRYLLECSNKMTGRLMSVLVTVFEKCISLSKSIPNLDGVNKMLDALWCFVACRVRQLVFNLFVTNEHYQELSKLAVAFTLEALRDPIIAKKHKHSAMSLFQHFTSSIVVKDIKITRYYLVLILQQEEATIKLKKEIKNFDTIVIQAWIKCSILTHGANPDELKVIQDYVLHLNEIRQIFVSPQDLQEFENSSESILVFIMYSMKKWHTLGSEQERMQYEAKWKQYFMHIEKWILIPITEEAKESELAFWIYRCIGTLILCTAPMLYSKSHANPLRALLNKAVLTPEDSTQTFIKDLGKRIFSMILLGIETLSVQSDISLQTLIRDLFDQYLPYLIVVVTSPNHFKVSEALLKCFRDAKPEFLRIIFKMLMSNFFTMSADNSMHKHFYLVMTLLQNLLKGEKIYASHVTECIITICTPLVIGCYVKVHDHHPHKQQTIEFINNVVKSPYYKENNSMREKFNNSICDVVKTSLCTNQQSTFELLRAISSIRVEIIKSITPQIEHSLINLETNRRSNAASLRYSWSQLRGQIKNAESKLYTV